MTGGDVEYIGADKADGVGRGFTREPDLSRMHHVHTEKQTHADAGIVNFKPEFILGAAVNPGEGGGSRLAEGEHPDHDPLAGVKRNRLEGLLYRKRFFEINKIKDTELEVAAQSHKALIGFFDIKRHAR